jgi:ribosome-binding protein aMBF1 (putative translation factor)
MKDMLSTIIDEKRKDAGMSQTDLAAQAWPEKERQAALVKYQRIMNGQPLTMKDGTALAQALGLDLSRLIVLADERRKKK